MVNLDLRIRGLSSSNGLLLLDSGSGRCDKSIGAPLEGYTQPLCMQYLHLHLLCDSIRIYSLVSVMEEGEGRGQWVGGTDCTQYSPTRIF